MRERILRGIPISGGVGIGEIYLHRRELPKVEEKIISEEEIDKEVRHFQMTLEEVENELDRVYQMVREEMGRDVADFVFFQILLLKDSEIRTAVTDLIRKNRWSAAYAYFNVIQNYLQILANSPYPFVQERGVDVADCAHRVLWALNREERKNGDLSGPFTLAQDKSPRREIVLFAQTLSPTEVAILDKRLIKGIALEIGGKLGHIAIMTRAKEIPAVNGVSGLLSIAEKVSSRAGIVDGARGLVILAPSERRISQYKGEIEAERKKRSYYSLRRSEEPVTLDGKYIDISANIEFIGEATRAKEYGAKGIGLFRTEYIFLSRRRLPTEEEQIFFYKEVSEKMKPYPVIIRTFDLGGDKVLPGYSETNPFLGWRGIRVGLVEKRILKEQLRAILRASAENRNLKIMFPMITTIEEIQEARTILRMVKEELKREGNPFDEKIEFGIMVETPSCALLAERFGRICSFFSIGSNDLTQYTLACARDNERVSHLYDPFHPTVVRLYKETIDAARRCGIWVGVCGEIASEPLGIILLVGLGVDELSMVPARVPEAKEIIRHLEYGKLQEGMEKVLAFSTAKGVKRFLTKEAQRYKVNL